MRLSYTGMGRVDSNPKSFLEANFWRAQNARQHDEWHDESTHDYFVFSSQFGTIRLRKRTVYPATFAYIHGPTLCFGYGDSTVGKNIAYSSLDTVSEQSFYFDEFLYVEADCMHQQVLMQRDAMCTVPVFACSQTDRLILSNKFERVCQLADTSNLHVNDLTISAMLTGQSTGPRTVFREVNALYDRARIFWTNGVMRQYAAPDSSLLHVTLNRDGDARIFHKLFGDVLEYYRNSYTQPGVTVAAELSGGTDSSLLNQYLAAQGVPLCAATLMYAGDFGKTQTEKLSELQTRFGLTSYRVPLEPSTDYPLASMVRSGTWQPFYHDQELYLESYNRIIEYFVHNDAAVVFRGVGGDELGENIPELNVFHGLGFSGQFYRKAQPLESWAKPELESYIRDAVSVTDLKPTLPLMSSSVVVAPLCGNNQYLDHDIWPVMPFANPALYVYCQSLPIRYRSRKNLFRAYMRALGFPSSVYASPVKEHFGYFFYHAAKPNLQKPFEDLMQRSVLAKAGLIDADAACHAWETTRNA